MYCADCFTPVRKYYFQSWMLFDIIIVTFDYLFVILNLGETDLHSLRFLRILRVLRLIRIIKLSKLNTMIEESAAAAGRQWVTLVVAITKTGVGMIMVAHFLTCFWYFTGEFIVGYDTPLVNWIEYAGARVAHEKQVEGWVQYLHALRWILNAPSPPDLDAASGIERGVDILISVTTLVVIGSVPCLHEEHVSCFFGFWAWRKILYRMQHSCVLFVVFWQHLASLMHINAS